MSNLSRWLLISVITLTLVSMNPQSTLGQTTIVSEDFSAGFPGSWTHYNGNLSVTGGFMTLGYGCVVLPGTFDRSLGLAIEADVNITWPAAGDFNIFAFYDIYSSPDPRCLFIASDGYGFGVYPAGSDNPEDLLDAVVGGIYNRVMVPATSTAGQWTHVRAEIEPDGDFRLLLNGVESATNYDLSHAGGPIILRTWGDVLIDNVKVEALLASCSYGPSGQPIVFSRGKGAPSKERFEWESCGGTGVLSVHSASVSSATLALNGEQLAGPPDFGPSTTHLSIPIHLAEGANYFEFEIAGKPGASLSLSFTSDEQ